MVLDRDEILNYLEGVSEKIEQCENVILSFENQESFDVSSITEFKKTYSYD